ncbi:MAG: NADH-dependent dehydrogenase [Bryobacteraceae bacterium]|nr:MAG: NADH-dependent dehydrogenase [Bryobacteraceae bacterium]
MTQPFRGAMAGAGYFAQFHAEAWSRIPEAEITAVADPDAGRAKTFAERHRIPRVYASVEEMLRTEQPQFLDIVTRPDTHLPLTELAASRGVNVICQKPMAPSLAECEAMVRAAEAAGVRLLIHENWRWQPWYREIRRLLDEGAVGRPFLLSFLMRTGDGRGPEPYSVQPYFRSMPRLLNYETLVHFLDTFRFLLGEIESVYCETARIHPSISGEDAAWIHLHFRSGAAGLIDANRISGPMPPPPAFGDLRCEGDSAVLCMDGYGKVFLCGHGAQPAVHEYPVPQRGYKGDSVHAFQRHALRCLLTGEPCESEGRTYLRTVRLVEACYESAAARRVVAMEEYGD